MKIEEYLCTLGDEWLEQKKQRMLNLLKIAEPNEALYREIMLSFGYSKNKLQFQALALIFPYQELRQLSSKEIIEKALLYRSGLSDIKDKIPKNFDFSLRMDKELWIYKGVRPQNYPEVRINEVSELLWQTKKEGISIFFEEKIKENFNKDINKTFAIRIVNKIIDSKGPGNERKLEIFFNILLPFYIVLLQAQPRYTEFLYSIFKHHPPLGANSKIKRAVDMIKEYTDFDIQRISSAQLYFGSIQLCSIDTDQLRHNLIP